MISRDHLKTLFVRSSATPHMIRLPRGLDPTYQTLRRAVGRRELLRNLESARVRVACDQ